MIVVVSSMMHHDDVHHCLNNTHDRMREARPCAEHRLVPSHVRMLMTIHDNDDIPPMVMLVHCLMSLHDVVVVVVAAVGDVGCFDCLDWHDDENYYVGRGWLCLCLE